MNQDINMLLLEKEMKKEDFYQVIFIIISLFLY